ncbi:MAG: tetratricopeptide repeat protein, partial [Betaproteobacteria bacterium]
MTLQQALHEAVAHHQAGRLADAERLYRAILSTMPDQFDALHLLARIAMQSGHPQDAETMLQRAVGINPASIEAQLFLASVRNALAHYEMALAGADHVLALQPQSMEAWAVRGMALHNLLRVEEALASYDHALTLQPNHPGILCNRGAALKDLKRHEEALQCYDQVLAVAPGMAEAWSNRGGALSELGRHADALSSCDRALALLPEFGEAFHNRGAALSALGYHEDAIASYSSAIALMPRFAQAYYNRGSALGYFKRHGEACADFKRALVLDPGVAFAAGALLHSRMHCCIWNDWDQAVTQLLADVRAGKRVAEPMTIAAVARSPADILDCARTWVATHAGRPREPLWRGEKYAHDRIRVSYLSAEFHDHATTQLMAELFESHDRQRFDVTAISYGPAADDAMRRRLLQAFEHFVDVRERDDLAIAQWLREHEIDIAIDLKGYTYEGRIGMLAHRAAPVQVSYLGYPGTLGAPWLDYVLADSELVPEGDDQYYAEQVVRLPWSYQVNDRHRQIDPMTPPRAAAGLPEQGFVFCCFNSNY